MKQTMESEDSIQEGLEEFRKRIKNNKGKGKEEIDGREKKMEGYCNESIELIDRLFWQRFLKKRTGQ